MRTRTNTVDKEDEMKIENKDNDNREEKKMKKTIR